MTMRLTILTPLVFGLTAVWTSGLSHAAPPGGGGKVTPTLTVTVSPSTIAENQTATGTVSRINASLTSELTVTLDSSDKTEAKFDVAVNVAKTVTIPTGASNATFTVTGVNDGTGDGAKTVTITAVATGFKSGSVNVTAASPELPPVRYRVQFIPTPANAHCQDVNDSHETVGWFTQTTNGRDINTGFYYNAASREYLTATDMVPELTDRSTQFIGINNQGWIVGSLADANGIRSGILIYPSASGWSYEVVPGPDNAYEYYPRDISDSGDVVGVYWRLNENGTQGLADAFAYNPGLHLETDLLAPTPFGLADAHLYSIQVSNQGRGLAVDSNTGDGWWFDFVTEMVTPVVVPDPYYIILTGLVTHSLSNDGQLAVARIATTTKVRGGYTYTYTPGIVQDGLLLWKGDFEGRTFFVNSAVYGNLVGDAVGWSNGFQTQWLQHADWGKLDMENMLVFEFPEDQVRWLLYDHFAKHMSDRDSTGFGMVVGDNSNSNELFVLLPEIVP